MYATATVQINLPQDIVFNAFTDFEKLPQILNSAYFVEFHSPNKEGLGAKWTQKSGEMDNPTEAIHTVTKFDPPNSFTMTSDDKAAVETFIFTFEPNPQGTLVTFNMTISTKGCLYFFAAPFLKKVIVQAMTEDLNRMKEYIETTFA